MSEAVSRQRSYYESTAANYSNLHVRAGDEHYVALEYISGLMTVLRATSVLDVGSGTGRAVRFLSSLHPSARVVGIEPVGGLRLEAAQLGGEFLEGSGEDLPFADGEFDVVIATGVLHHVSQPSLVVSEMARVAKKGVMISDANRFGQGSPLAKCVKIALSCSHLWGAAEYVQTRGKRYKVSDSDGVFYSYSIYDSIRQLSAWGERTFVIPTMSSDAGVLGPYWASPHGLLVSVREPRRLWAGQ